MTVATVESSAEQEIRDVLDSFLKTVSSKDVEAIMDFYASEVVAFDAIAALQFKGAKAYGDHWRQCLSMCDELSLEASDIHIATAGDLATSHYLHRCAGVDDKGEEQACWMRATVIWRRQDGGWKIIHDHYSAPFDPESGQALMGLSP
ncbi:MAG: YybH family protein [Pseudomonadota bacterium]|uniref:YybH family protein n=1 Tax=Fodinicurvata fenggangensis TaxID=1121830 RepID=UPI0004786DEB|nr:nuclear transport factor 2 family protein [Fodinicurvata fenggangensis]